jgi:hypothetical protein
VISIFRLLGIGVVQPTASSTIKLDNHFIQILTGEGKSVTLAIVSIVLALSGYEVDCACYSEYLTRRDYDDFKELFKAFHVTDSITYGTFGELCERFINDQGSIRNAVEKYVKTGEMPPSTGCEVTKRKVLIIDEVDVCFNKDFYGERYYPVASVKSEKIKQFVLKLWEERSSLRSFGQVTKLGEYAAVLSELSGRDAIFEEVAKQIFADLRANCDFAFLSADEQDKYKGSHVVRDNRIGYVDSDGISWTKQEGFKTMFLYIFEHERDPGKIDEVARNRNIALKFWCGGFSYAEIPKKYNSVLGVTGTLEDLSQKEKEILKNDFQIKLQTFVPSMYKKTNLDWTPNNKKSVMIEESTHWHEGIMNEIKLRRSQLAQNPAGPLRPVLVFFASIEELEKFKQSKGFEKAVRVIDGKEDLDRRKQLIGKSMAPGEITLLSRVLGRGTDFRCQGAVDLNGGVHVLQTFVTESKAEETQIKGRTARQNQQGSYSMVLCAQSLETFGITPEPTTNGGQKEGEIYDIKTMYDKDSLYDTINKRRNDRFDKDYKNVTDSIEEIREDHQQAIAFREALFSRDETKVRDVLVATNKCHMDVMSVESAPRTIIMVDATCSMSQTISDAKIAVELIVKLCFDLINGEGGKYGTSFELQVGVYRNYNTRRLIEVSPWASSAGPLNEFIRPQDVDGGWGNEAIEVALQHVLSQHSDENPVGQVIIIGDMPSNTRSETDWKRAKCGSEGFPPKLYYDDMIKEIRDKGISLHAFATEERTVRAFQAMVNLGNADGHGICGHIDVHSNDSVGQLGEKITERILAQQQAVGHFP